MEGRLGASSFSFVNYRGPRLSADPNVRRIIRQQAMEGIAAARKRSGRYGKYNIGQYPPPSRWEQKPDGQRLPLQGGFTSPNAVQQCQRCRGATLDNGNKSNRYRQYQDNRFSNQHAPLHRTPCSAFEISESDFLLLKLAPLTGLRLGVTTWSHLRYRPSRHKDHFFSPHLGTRKLLSFIPSRYHEVPLLRYATNCVTAKLKHMLQGPDCWATGSEALVLAHYNRAVKALRVALEDEGERLHPETLCAVELLCAFEVLNDYSNPHSWLHHVTGAARLIEARGSGGFKTDFDMALFTTSIGPTVMEAFLSNKSCFLEKDNWRPILRRAVFSDSNFANQNHLVFALWHYLFAGPRMFRETTDVIVDPSTSEHTIEALIQRLLQARSGLTEWLSHARQLRRETMYDPLDESYDDPDSQCRTHNGGNDSENITQLTLRGTFTMCHILKARLLYALAPSRFHHLEVECQKLAEEIVESNQDLCRDGDESLRWSSFVSQSVWLANGIKETKQSWSEGWQERKGVIERWKFEAWCKAIGRTSPSSWECA
ncbi:hypothetical protein H2200_013207 [Cladophialophora chaetospira]|uniref:C6 zinc finger domain protein n=1 Tax=Cladophialophora chaetospira TaxID=386627 RepID=A0AA38WWE2_9EURO|nr:hypothetical protein H2200_013207 [Cladophialophora chaetospira]